MKEPDKAPEKTEPAKAPEEPKAPEKAPAKADEKPEAKAETVKLDPPADRKALEAMVKKYGVEAAVEALTKVRVVDLRSLAREYNGEFGIAGREIRNANKKVLIEEFRKFFSE